MMGTAPQSPTARGVPNVQERIALLDAYERWRKPTLVDFESIVGQEAYKAYWQNWIASLAKWNEARRLPTNSRRKLLEPRKNGELGR